jgi:hypothetical protein
MVYIKVFLKKKMIYTRRKIFASTTTVDTTMSNARNCFVPVFTQITSCSIMSFVLYICSENVWEKPNIQENR